MTKAASAEIGQRRFYHSTWDDRTRCTCSKRRDTECPYTFPSVTTLLKAYPKEWLGPWAAKMVAEIAVNEATAVLAMAAVEGQKAAIDYLKGAPWRARDEAAERGTAAHKAAEEGTAIEDVPENARKRVESWRRWVDDWNPDILLQEVTVYNPMPTLRGWASRELRYAGTLDLIADVQGETWLIDLKAAEARHSHRLQLAAYRYADFIGNEDGPIADMPRIDRTAVLSLRDDGYSWLEVSAGTDEYHAFLSGADFGRRVQAIERGPVGREVTR